MKLFSQIRTLLGIRRSKKKVLQLILKDLKSDYKKSRTDPNITFYGICGVIRYLQEAKLITSYEGFRINKYLAFNKPTYNQTFSPYWFTTKGTKAYTDRFQYLNKLIDQCKSEDSWEFIEED